MGLASGGSYSRNIPTLRAIRTLGWMHFFGAVLIPFYTQWGGLSLSQAMMLNSWFMLWNALLEIPTGTVADYLGRKVSLALGSLLGATAALVYVSKPDILVFMAAEIVFAASYTLHSGADEALAYDSMKAMGRESRTKPVLASLESYKLAGILLGTTIGAPMAAWFGLAAPMAAYAVPAGMAFLLALTLREPPRASPQAARRSYGAILREGGRYFLGHRALMALALESALTNAVAWGIIWLFQPLLERAGVPLAWYGAVQAAACVGQILFLSRVELVEELVGSKRRVLTWTAYGSGAAFAGLAAAGSAWAVIPGIVVAFTLGLPRTALFSAYMNKHIPSDKRATVLSFASMVRTLAIVVANPLIGLAADHSLTAALAGMGVAMILVTAFSRIEERHLLD